MGRPASSSKTFKPFSVSSLAAQPPVIPEPITMASYSTFGISHSPLGCSHLKSFPVLRMFCVGAFVDVGSRRRAKARRLQSQLHILRADGLAAVIGTGDDHFF